MRRYKSIAPSKGTVILTSTRIRVLLRDNGCVGFGRLPGPCEGGLELDHVRASHGIGLKSVTCDCNLVSLCNSHHLHKTLNGHADRPILLDYLATYGYSEHADGHLDDDCGHVDPVFGCRACDLRMVPA